MDAGIPEGFELLEPAAGFGARFGPIWVHRTAHRIGFRVGAQHVNPRNVCHGGALSTFADYQIVAVIDASIPLHQAPPTISLSVDYLGPVPLASWVEGEVVLLRETRTLMFTQTVLTVDGSPVARCNGLYRKSTQTDRRHPGAPEVAG